jgi:hypothetical protein
VLVGEAEEDLPVLASHRVLARPDVVAVKWSGDFSQLSDSPNKVQSIGYAGFSSSRCERGPQQGLPTGTEVGETAAGKEPQNGTVD